jgi:UDP:flavonoid glycosyltransferase YjiC (YdhE family)
MLTLGKVLQQRGHQLTLFGLLDSEEKVISADIKFQAFGESDFPRGAIAKFDSELGQLTGFAALQYTIDWFRKLAETFLKEVPDQIQSLGVDALLVDQTTPEGGTVAERLSIPFATICSGLILHRDPKVPPYATLWRYSSDVWASLRNCIGHTYYDFLERPIWRVILDYRRSWNLPIHSTYDQYYSQKLQISQQVTEFEFTRLNLPANLYFTGPFCIPSTRKFVPFPYEKLTGQPLIYVSLGTVLNHLTEVFEQIAQACIGLDAQVVITLGRETTFESLPQFPGSPIVVGYAPQLELLPRTALTISHGGMNTTLECLKYGVPMVAVPICNDQPGIAMRLSWTGAGIVVPIQKISVPRLRTAIKTILTDKNYKTKAMQLQQAIANAGGVEYAANLVEWKFQ